MMPGTVLSGENKGRSLRAQLRRNSREGAGLGGSHGRLRNQRSGLKGIVCPKRWSGRSKGEPQRHLCFLGAHSQRYRRQDPADALPSPQPVLCPAPVVRTSRRRAKGKCQPGWGRSRADQKAKSAPKTASWQGIRGTPVPRRNSKGRRVFRGGRLTCAVPWEGETSHYGKGALCRRQAERGSG